MPPMPLKSSSTRSAGAIFPRQVAQRARRPVSCAWVHHFLCRHWVDDEDHGPPCTTFSAAGFPALLAAAAPRVGRAPRMSVLSPSCASFRFSPFSPRLSSFLSAFVRASTDACPASATSSPRGLFAAAAAAAAAAVVCQLSSFLGAKKGKPFWQQVFWRETPSAAVARATADEGGGRKGGEGGEAAGEGGGARLLGQAAKEPREAGEVQDNDDAAAGWTETRKSTIGSTAPQAVRGRRGTDHGGQLLDLHPLVRQGNGPTGFARPPWTR